MLIILRNVYHITFIFHILIGLSKNMTPIDFKFTRSKGKVTRVTFVKYYVTMVLHNIFRTVYHRALL